MADASPICRGKNLTMETVLAFVNAIPTTSLPKEQFYEYGERHLKGWKQTHSQIARQMALYYEDNNGICHPRFTKDVCIEQIIKYTWNWAHQYFVPNPYTPSLQNSEYISTNIYAFIKNEILKGNTSFNEACNNIFGINLNNIDKVRVFLTNFTDIIIIEDEMFLNEKLNEANEYHIYPNIDIKTAEDYFSYFSLSDESYYNKPILRPSKPLQQIFYGAPGTGKSHTVKKETAEWEKRGRVVRTTFHPDSDYSTFVGTYKPTKKEVYVRDSTGRIVIEKDKPVKEEQISYEFVPQAFLNAYIEAWTNRDKPEFLIIEEINRGNCAQIFGDLFQLLDRDDNGYSEYAIKADRDLEMYLNKAFEDADIEDYPNVKSGKELLLPNNLYIRATMNTSDQSLFPIDSAFKRRWDWEYEPIKYKNTDWAIEINGNKYSWTSFQKEVNKRIFDDTNSEDKMLGDYFVKANNENVISEKLFVNKVLFYLWNDVCKDGDSDIFKIDDKTDVKFSDLYGENGTKMLLGMMDHLGVELISEEVQSESEDQSDETVSSTKHKKLNAVVLNGIRYDSSQGKFNLYLNVINKIGIEKVASIVEQSKYKRLGHPLISTTKYEEIEKSQQYGYEQVGDYYFVKGMNDDTKINLLELIKSELQLDMQIEIE